MVAASSSSLNSENPYATIKDLPGPPFCPPESSYMEMKAAVPRERAYTEISPPPFSMATLRRGEVQLKKFPQNSKTFRSFKRKNICRKNSKFCDEPQTFRKNFKLTSFKKEMPI